MRGKNGKNRGNKMWKKLHGKIGNRKKRKKMEG